MFFSDDIEYRLNQLLKSFLFNMEYKRSVVNSFGNQYLYLTYRNPEY